MPELGTKYECVECGAKFYDLGKAEPVCPKCETNQRLHQEQEAAAAAAAAAAKAKQKEKEQEKEKEVEEEIDSLDSEEGEDLLEDEINGA